ncbi:MAG: nucleotide exchange factor GrpE [Candidatus Woesearchaeota archaeon]
MTEKNQKEKSEKSQENEELESLKQQLQQISENHLRLQAEFANYKRRNETLSQDAYERGVLSVMKKLVDLYDDFDIALTNKSCSAEDFKKGMELIYAKLFSLGEEFNLEHIDCLGKQFDPRLHEALLTEVSEKPESEILEELQKGYKINETVLRHSKVKVSKGNQNNKR